MVERAQITVRGIVQGVGFRPFVYRLAESLGLKGFVTNTAEGVSIDVEGENLAEFIKRLPGEAPPLSRIEEIVITPLPEKGHADFRIIESRNDESRRLFTLISPDVSACDDCLRELLDPGNRRYLHPFINCTNCGPRYTITRSVPYDRPNTTMKVFEMCRACSAEYHDPKDRRFHAQPNACPECGPQVELRITHSPSPSPARGEGYHITPPLRGGDEGEGENPIATAIRLLMEGAIVAIKGIGGFHIACDAMNESAVSKLRDRKRRSNKPFALMAPNVEAIERFCEVSDEERRLLVSNRRPIVLLRKKEDMRDIPEVVSPHNRYVGFMLPYTPLHYLLFYYPASHNPGASNFTALVMTSGNMSEEPIVRDNDEAAEKLSSLVDAFLLHNRDIFMRVDDSVLRVVPDSIGDGISNNRFTASPIHPFTDSPIHRVSFIRRSRGYAPEPVALSSGGPEVMGCGADIKNTFTLTKGSFAIPSQHIGDMENYETLKFFEECLENLKGTYRVNPVAIGHDLHPGYLSTQWALGQRAEGIEHRVKIYGIQHHYAHIASVMAEHGLTGKVIGVAFDGTGYGTDGNLWGGEFLIAGLEGFERAGHFRYIPLPGGEMAIREPWKTAVSYLLDAAGSEAMDYLKTIGFCERYGKENIEKIMKVIRSPELSPLSSGAGRLFDAVSALIGLCDRNTFEGEAAMALESLIRNEADRDYPVNIVVDKPIIVDFSQTMIDIAGDLSRGTDGETISMKFHNTVASVILRVATRIGETRGLKDVVLSGGTFQNRYLLGKTLEMLEGIGMNVFINRAVPCNDACISLGQAYVVRERLKRGAAE